MLTVIGPGKHALLAAAHAAARSSEPVGLTDEQVVRPGGDRTFYVARGDSESSVTLVGADRTVFERSDRFLVMVEAPDLLDVCERYGSWLAGAHVLLAPGNFAGSVRVADWFTAARLTQPFVGELSGFPVVGGVDGDHLVIRGTKDGMPCGTPGGGRSAELITAFEHYLPPMVPARALEVGLGNTNHLVHPVVVLANLAAVDAGRELLFYRDGVTPAVAELLLAVDCERLAVGRAAGVSLSDVEQLFRDLYREMSGSKLHEMLSRFPAFVGSPAPTALSHRYVVDDVRYGLAGIEAMGVRLAVPTPHLSAVITLLATAAGEDLRTDADVLAAALLAADSAGR